MTPTTFHLRAPQTPKTPKLTGLGIKVASNGFQVTHSYDHPFHAKQFVFRDPKTMLQHINRIEHSAWRHQNINQEAQHITRDLNL
jgi:hypothetical protein